jgi:DSBA-like thioredoxin domain
MPPSGRALHASVPATFAVTWDYRCPFARNAHEHVLTGLHAGADWDVTFLPFSLGQAHVEPGDPDVWDEPERDTGLFALQCGVAARDYLPEHFLGVHRALFEHRHAAGGHLRSADDLRAVLAATGVDADAVFDLVATGKPLATIKAEHSAYAASHHVWGVPTFIVGDQAAFVRLMDRSGGDTAVATGTVERIVSLLTWPSLNEFKHTSIPS